MVRQNRSQLYIKIISALKSTPSTIHQVALETSINWETVKTAIRTLENIGLTSSKEKNGKIYYYIDESNIINLEKDTLLGIPLTKEQRKTTLQLSKRIQERWNPPRKLLKTFRNKILVKVIKETQIQNIPYGWYLFGECILLQTEDFMDVKGIGTKYDKEIDNAIQYYSNCQTTNELMEKTYVDEDNTVYLSRLKIVDRLMNKFSDNSLVSLRIELRNLLFSFKKKEDNEDLIEFLNGFSSYVMRMIKKMSSKELEEIRPIMLETSTAIWELIATYNLYESLSRNEFFTKESIKKYYSLRIESLKQVAEEYLFNLKDHYPPLEIPAEDPLRRFIPHQVK